MKCTKVDPRIVGIVIGMLILSAYSIIVGTHYIKHERYLESVPEFMRLALVLFIIGYIAWDQSRPS